MERVVGRPVTEWLEAGCLPYVRRVTRRVAYTYNLSDADAPDLFQELCLALWKAGPHRLVNPTWIFHTANHLAIEIFKRRRRAARLSAAVDVEMRCVRAPETPEHALLIRARADRLPPRLRRFYELRFQEGYTHRELMGTGLTRGVVREIERKCVRRLAGRAR